MIRIGEFIASGDGYSGRLQTLGLDVALTIVPASPSEARNAPDYRVHAGEDAAAPEIGAGWKRSSERAGAYVALVIDDPQLPRAIRANLFRPAAEEQPHPLFWQRNLRRRDTGDQ